MVICPVSTRYKPMPGNTGLAQETRILLSQTAFAGNRGLSPLHHLQKGLVVPPNDPRSPARRPDGNRFSAQGMLQAIADETGNVLYGQ